MRILLTGGSSFTGLWFARSLAARGHTVVAALKGSDYSACADLVAELRRVAEVVEDCPFGSPLSRTRRHRLMGSVVPACSQTGDYRNPDFDVMAPSPTIRKILPRF